MALEIIVLKQCEKEVNEFSDEIRKDYIIALAKLSIGLILQMPLSKSLSNIHKGLHELRLKDNSGIYRVIYYLKKDDAIYVIHAFKKKTQKLPLKNIMLIKSRMRSLK